MATRAGTFVQWLTQAGISADRLTVEQTAVLQAAFRFRERVGTDYYSTRFLSHFLLHCGSGFAVAQIARLLSISRPTASRQQGLSSKEVIQAAHHRMAGRAHGKLLPRYAGPIAEFIVSHPDALCALACEKQCDCFHSILIIVAQLGRFNREVG